MPAGGEHPSNQIRRGADFRRPDLAKRKEEPVPALRKLFALPIALTLLVAVAPPASALSPPGVTELVSIGPGNAQPDGDSANPSISAGGRFVAFQSDATNLVPGDTNGKYDIFVRDMTTGDTERVSVASDGAEANGSSTVPSISADGRYVAFRTAATNLGTGIYAVQGIFVHDRETGSTEMVSVDSNGNPLIGSGGYVASPAISADGSSVAFVLHVQFSELEAWNQVYVHDRDTGVTENASVASDGTHANGDAEEPSLSGDGRYVAFQSYASNLVPGDTNARNGIGINWDVFVHDRETGETERVSVTSDGRQSEQGTSREPSISTDGRYVAFQSSARLVPGNSGPWEEARGLTASPLEDVYVHDRETGATERVSVKSHGAEGYSEASSRTGGGANSRAPSISADGRYVAFWSNAHLVSGDTNPYPDVFVHDRAAGATERVSVGSDGKEVVGPSFGEISISGDGRRVAFMSGTPLVPGAPSGACNVYVSDDGCNIYARYRGPATGPGGMTTAVGAGDVDVSGWVRFSDPVQTAAADSPDDGGAAHALGAELTGSSVAYRHEEGDLLIRLNARTLPPVAAGMPSVLYGLRFTSAGGSYEVRSARTAAATASANPHFGLYRCFGGSIVLCPMIAELQGGMGTAGNDVRVSVPVEALGHAENISGVLAFTALGEPLYGAVHMLDQVALGDLAIQSPRVNLGISPAGAPESEVAFTTVADLWKDGFIGELDTSGLPAGDYRVWARACLEVCGLASEHVKL